MQIQRKEHTIVRIGPKKLLAIGGYCSLDQKMLSECEIYDLDLNIWTKVDHMKVPKCAFAACVCQNYDYVYTFGGFDGFKRLNIIERYSIQEDIWEIMPIQLNKNLSNAAAVCLG